MMKMERGALRSCLADPQVRTMFARGLSRGEVLNRMDKVHQDVVNVVSDSVECAPQKRNGPPQEKPPRASGPKVEVAHPPL
jgi:hypothetical protein